MFVSYISVKQTSSCLPQSTHQQSFLCGSESKKNDFFLLILLDSVKQYMQHWEILLASLLVFNTIWRLRHTDEGCSDSSVSAVKLYPEKYSCNMWRVIYNQDIWVYIVLYVTLTLYAWLANYLFLQLLPLQIWCPCANYFWFKYDLGQKYNIRTNSTQPGFELMTRTIHCLCSIS